MVKAIAVADDILSYCTSCKIDLAHVVVAILGDRVKKVECNTCKKVHAYRIPKGEKEAKKKKKATRRASSPKVPIEMEWAQLMELRKAATSKPYSARGNFSYGDKIDHKSFGEGVVGRMIYPNKIEVVFQHDMKVLIHGGAPPSAS